MKITVTQYARALYDVVAGKTAAEIKTPLKNFVALLGARRDLGRAEAIIQEFENIWQQENAELSASLVSARELGPTARDAIGVYLKDRTGAKKIHLHESIDKSLLGGFVLKYGSKVLDGSLRFGLNALRARLKE